MGFERSATVEERRCASLVSVRVEHLWERRLVQQPALAVPVEAEVLDRHLEFPVLDGDEEVRRGCVGDHLP